MFCAKNGSKKDIIFEKWPLLENGKIGHHAKAIVFAKNGQFGSKIKVLRNMQKNDSTNSLELLCEKNGCKKHLIFEKWPLLENGQNWPPCKGL